MRLIVLPFAALALIGADGQPAGETAVEIPAEAASGPDRATCRDRIEEVRAASGQPPLIQRGPATPDEALLIYAVDRRQDGCAVMVVKGDPSDIRPVPEQRENAELLWPARPSN